MATDKFVSALVTSRTWVNHVLHFPGELVQVNLTALGVDALGKDKDGVDKTPGLVPAPKDGEQIEKVEVAPVSPHAPNPSAPQSLSSGSVISGTGRTLTPADAESGDLAREMVAPEPAAPTKSGK
jgi:hypothetical protein